MHANVKIKREKKMHNHFMKMILIYFFSFGFFNNKDN